jgi:hypothetical protein
VGQDWQTGQIYALDPSFFTDNGQPIVFRRSFPHVVKNLHEITTTAFVADFETGQIEGFGDTGTEAGNQSPWSSGFSTGFGPLIQGFNSAKLFMRASKDSGKKFSNYRGKGLLGSGNNRSMMRWRGIGQGRDLVFEVMWAFAGPSALQGAYIEQIEHST